MNETISDIIHVEWHAMNSEKSQSTCFCFVLFNEPFETNCKHVYVIAKVVSVIYEIMECWEYSF